MESAKKRFVMYSVLLAALLALSLWIIKPFILTIIAGVIIAYIFYPIHKWLVKRIKSNSLSAFIVAILIILIFTVPLFFLVQEFAKDAYVSYVLLKQSISTAFFSGQPCTQEGVGCSFVNWVESYIPASHASFYFDDALSRITQWAVSKANDVIVSIPSILLQLVVLLFVIYYALKDGKVVVKKIFSFLSLRKDHAETILKKTKSMISSTIYGIMVVAAIQGAFAGIGYFIFGVKSPVLLGMLTALAALIPVVGTAIVWAPTVAVYLVNAILANDSTGILMALGLLAYSIFPVSTIDNFIRPKIIGDRANVHPILILLGILGGVAAFGFVGILLGPIIISLFVIFVDIYQEERIRA